MMILIATITNKLFGWHWVEHPFGFSKCLRRVRTSPAGKKYIVIYGYIYYLEPDGSSNGQGGKYYPFTFEIDS